MGLRQGVEAVGGEVTYKKPEEDLSKHEGGILDAAAYGNNFLYSLYKNKTDAGLMIGEGDTPLDWTSDRTQEILEPLSADQVDNLSPRIYTEEHLEAVVARQKKEHENAKYLDKEVGETAATVMKVGAGLIDADILAGGVIFKGARLAHDVWKANTATKIALGAGAGATDALVSDAMIQATQGTDKTAQRLFAASFGGVVGGALGKWSFDGNPNVKEGVSLIDRTVRDTQPEVTEEILKTSEKQAVAGRLKFGSGAVFTPGSRLHSSDDPLHREFADKMVSPVVAKTDLYGNLVPTKENAAWFKKKHQDQWTFTQRDLDVIYTEERKKGFKGTQKDFESSVHAHYVSTKSKADKAALEGAGAKILADTKEATKKKGKRLTKDEREAIIDLHTKERLDGVKLDYSHANKALERGAKSLAKYYNYMGGTGKNLKVEGMEHLRVNGFHPRSFDINKVTSDVEGFVDNLTAALRGHAENAAQTDKELRKAAYKIKDNIIETHARRAKGLEAGSAKTKETKRRSIAYHDEDMLEWLDTNVGEVGQSYSRATSGRLALREALGYSTRKAFNEKMNELGIKSTKDMEVLFDTIAGTRIPKLGTVTRLAMKTSRMLASPGFVLASIPELVLPGMVQGFGNTMKYMFPGMQSSIQALRGKHISNDLANEIHALGLAGDIVNARQFNRMDTDDTIHSLGGNTFWGKVENKLDVANHGIYKYGGLGYVTEVSEVVAATGGLNWLLKVARQGAQGQDLTKLARLGLDESDLLRLQDEVANGVIKVDKKGNLLEINSENWAEGLEDKILFALDNHTKSTIIRPDGASLPILATGDNDLVQLSTQFLHYPIAMFEKLTLRGMSELDANVVIATMTSLGLAAAVTQLRDIGNPEPRYDLDTDKGTKNFLMYCLQNNIATATPMLAVEKGLGVLGKSTGGYRPGMSSLLGPSVAYGDKTIRALGKLSDGEVAEGMSKMPNPAHKVPLLGNYIKQAQEALGE